MKSGLKHSVVWIVLASYVFVGTIGCVNAFNYISAWGTRSFAITKAKSSPSSRTKALWTQQNHFPTPLRVEVPSPAVVTEPRIEHHQILWSIITHSAVQLRHLYLLFDHSSRAPPVA